MKGVPWSPSGEKKDDVVIEFPSGPVRAPPPAREELEEGLPRSTPITQRHLDKVGYTGTGCAKCRAMLLGDEVQPRGHSAACRSRVYKALRDDPELRRDMERADERKESFQRRKQGLEEAGEESSSSSSSGEEPTRTSRTRAGGSGEHHERGASAAVQDEMELDQPDAGAQRNSQKRVRDRDQDADEQQRVQAYRQLDEDEGGGGLGERLSPEPPDQRRQVPDHATAAVGVAGRESGSSLDPAPGVVTGTENVDMEELPDRQGEPPGGWSVPVCPPRPVRGPALGNVMESDGPYDACEAFSQARTSARATQRGLRGGWSLDVNHRCPVTGRTWDLSDPVDQRKCKHLVHRTKPEVLTVSPPCTLFSILQNLSGGVKDPEALKKAIAMIDFAVELCEIQNKAGRLYVFEHPASATSWRLESLKRLAATPGTHEVNFDMCQFGMMQEDALGPGHIKKNTRLYTNSSAIDGLIDGKKCKDQHRHIPLLGGRAKHAAAYPEQLCDAFIDGMLMERRAKSDILMNLGETEDMCDRAEEDNIIRMTKYAIDDVTGKELDPALVVRAREEEMKGFKEFGVYDYVRREEARAHPTGKKVGVRWVDVDKGSSEAPVIRSRLVCQEFAGSEVRNDLFAATPPLSATRSLLSLAASKGRSQWKADRIMVVDVKKAFLYGKIDRTVFVELPKEDPMSKSGDFVGRLRKAMYGTQDAPKVWQAEVAKTMRELGFIPCVATPCLYFNPTTGVRAVVHVDDFLCIGGAKELDEFRKALEKKYKIKSTVIGPGPGEVRGGRFLGRYIKWTELGIEWEGDDKLYKQLMDEWQMNGASSMTSPWIKDEPQKDGDERPMNEKETKTFRRAAAQLNYIALDNPMISFASKELSRRMAKPVIGDNRRVKRVLRYLRGQPRTVYKFYWQDAPKNITVFTDSDWAGCVETRRSTTGGVMLLGGHLVHHWSRTQSNIALSSGEAELNASLRGGCEGLGEQTFLQEIGVNMEIEILGDSSAAQGTLARQGAGKTKHLAVKQLWLQDYVAKGVIKTIKVPRSRNCADVLTHAWSVNDVKHFERMNLVTVSHQRCLTEGGCVNCLRSSVLYCISRGIVNERVRSERVDGDHVTHIKSWLKKCAHKRAS